MDDDAWRLVHDDHRRIVINDTKRDLTRSSRPREVGPGLEQKLKIRLENVVDLDAAAARSDDGTTETHATGCDKPRDLRSCTPVQQRDNPVDAFARKRSRDRHDRALSGLAHGGGRTGPRGDRPAEDVRHNAIPSRMLPQTIDESARLKVGQKPE